MDYELIYTWIYSVYNHFALTSLIVEGCHNGLTYVQTICYLLGCAFLSV